jgi:hypothetical protein
MKCANASPLKLSLLAANDFTHATSADQDQMA